MDPSLVQYADVEPQIRRADYKVISRFSTLQGVGAPNTSVVQGWAVFHLKKLYYLPYRDVVKIQWITYEKYLAISIHSK